MNDFENTPFPGRVAANEQTAILISRFETTYRIKVEGFHPQVPTWVTFPEKGFITTESIFATPDFLAQKSLYFYKETGPPPRIYEATATEIYEFFETRQPWQDVDYYVFDEAMSWCIAVTHNDDVIVVGKYNRF